LPSDGFHQAVIKQSALENAWIGTLFAPQVVLEGACILAGLLTPHHIL
jgi:hypothetical protein